MHWSALCNSSEATESVSHTAGLRLELLAVCQASEPGGRGERSGAESSDLCQAAKVLGLWCLSRRSQGWRPSKNLKVPPPRRGLESRGLCSQVPQLTPEDPQPASLMLRESPGELRSAVLPDRLTGTTAECISFPWSLPKSRLSFAGPDFPFLFSSVSSF